MTNTNQMTDTSRVGVTCGFCGGKGRDPFGIMSPLSTCVVCGGRRQRTLRQPFIDCPYCRGTGVHPFTRLTCIICDGVGKVEIPANAVPCPRCGGSGRAADDPSYLWRDSHFYCTHCGGKGVVAAGS